MVIGGCRQKVGSIFENLSALDWRFCARGLLFATCLIRSSFCTTWPLARDYWSSKRGRSRAIAGDKLTIAAEQLTVKKHELTITTFELTIASLSDRLEEQRQKLRRAAASDCRAEADDRRTVASGV
ncbi:MAG: hypothetical protein DWI21_00255 [Planctomycetota bacterium]|nr:MAG: hypothetical protein DWI21_00255 [Planctomycetota bacterium]